MNLLTSAAPEFIGSVTATLVIAFVRRGAQLVRTAVERRMRARRAEEEHLASTD